MTPAKVLPFPATAPRRGRDEREFLPAALEIIDAPASPAGRATALTIILAAACAVAWASIGQVDIIASAPGQIVPVGRSKTVQPLEAGVVRAIRVDDGDHVYAGEPLIELDPTQAQADRTRLAHDLLQAELDRSRLAGLRQAWQTGQPPALDNPPADATTAQREAAAGQMRAQAAEQAAKLASLDQQIAQKDAESREAAATLAQLQATLPLVAAEAEVRREVMELQWGNRIAWLEAQQHLVDQQHQPAVIEQKQKEADAARAALQREREEVKAEYQKGVLTDLAKAEQQISQSREELVKATDRAKLQTLRAPIAGTVQQLAVHTVGGVVTSAEPLLVVVPDHPGLVVEARIANQDIGFVHAGQDAEIKVEAFNFTRYGLIHGYVIGISRDAIGDHRTQPPEHQRDRLEIGDDHSAGDASSPAYIARIALDQSDVATENGHVPLGPGMVATAEIKTGRRRVIEYLLSPIMRYQHDALHER